MDRRIRFLLVGAWNTAFGYGSFAALYGVTRLVGAHYLWALLGSQAVSIANAYFGYKKLVFRTQGDVPREAARFVGVYAALFGLNLILLPLLVRTGLHPLVAQALAVAVCIALSYAAHSLYTFETKDSMTGSAT